MGHEGPRNAVHPGQARQWLVLQDRQRAKVAARQALVNFLELCLNQVKVVQQPLRSGADVIAVLGLIADISVRLAQHADILLQAREESAHHDPGLGGAMRGTQAATVLGKTLQAKNFRAYRWLRDTLRAIQHVAQNRRCIRHQAQQLGLRHRVTTSRRRHPSEQWLRTASSQTEKP